MERAGLTPRMRDCVRFIESYIAEKGASPNYDEIKVALHVTSKGNVCRLVDSLEARGWITRKPNVARSISLVGPDGPAPKRAEERESGPRYELPTHVEAALQELCARRRTRPQSVVADAVALFVNRAGRAS